jgi:hypothetical protein
MGVIKAVRGVYASVGIAISTFAEKCYTACVFIETVTSKCPLRAIMCYRGSIKGMSVETIAGNGTCQFCQLHYRRTFHQQILCCSSVTSSDCRLLRNLQPERDEFGVRFEARAHIILESTATRMVAEHTQPSTQCIP